ncbi:RNA polymerase sigma factor [Flavitalea flava]
MKSHSQKKDPDTICARLREGDRKAFEEIYRSAFRLIYFICKTIVRDKTEAEDITSKTFLKLWETRWKFRSQDHIHAFLLVTSRNASFDYLRARQRQMKAREEIRYLSNETVLSHDEEIVRKDLIRELKLRLEKLSPKSREVIKFLYFKEKEIREVAAALGISPVTVSGHKTNALKKLREAFSLNNQPVKISPE